MDWKFCCFDEIDAFLIFRRLSFHRDYCVFDFAECLN